MNHFAIFKNIFKIEIVRESIVKSGICQWYKDEYSYHNRHISS